MIRFVWMKNEAWYLGECLLKGDLTETNLSPSVWVSLSELFNRLFTKIVGMDGESNAWHESLIVRRSLCSHLFHGVSSILSTSGCDGAVPEPSRGDRELRYRPRCQALGTAKVTNTLVLGLY